MQIDPSRKRARIMESILISYWYYTYHGHHYSTNIDTEYAPASLYIIYQVTSRHKHLITSCHTSTPSLISNNSNSAEDFEAKGQRGKSSGNEVDNYDLLPFPGSYFVPHFLKSPHYSTILCPHIRLPRLMTTSAKAAISAAAATVSHSANLFPHGPSLSGGAYTNYPFSIQRMR